MFYRILRTVISDRRIEASAYTNYRQRDPENRKFKEIMLLRKDGGTSMFVRKTLNGKFRGATWRAAYCPVETQRAYTDQVAKEREEAAQKAEWERKAAEERKAIEERSRAKVAQ